MDIPLQQARSERPPRGPSKSSLFLLVAVIIVASYDSVEARFKRCFNCRSRGILGDCKDPFNFNSSTFDIQANTKPSIDATPCASGWCAKIIEDDFGDSIAATERNCMTRPPTDNEERCSETIFENQRDRKVFLCMCYGDLCNAASVTSPSHIASLSTTVWAAYVIFTCRRHLMTADVSIT